MLIPLSYHPNMCEPYMNCHQLNYFKDRLLHWHDETTQQIKQLSLQLRTDNTRVPELIDQSQLEMERSMVLFKRNHKRQLIEQIDAALIRISNNSYGYCLETGEEIGLSRLLVQPAAFLHVEVQADREQQLRAFATAS